MKGPSIPASMFPIRDKNPARWPIGATPSGLRRESPTRARDGAAREWARDWTQSSRGSPRRPGRPARDLLLATPGRSTWVQGAHESARMSASSDRTSSWWFSKGRAPKIWPEIWRQCGSAASRQTRRGTKCATMTHTATSSANSRGPGATPAGHVLLPTHREVLAAAIRISAYGRAPAQRGPPRLPCVELRVCVPRRRE